MKQWERIRDGVDDLLDGRLPGADQMNSKLSGAPAPPQSHPTPPQTWGEPNTPKPVKRRRPRGTGEIDVHLRLPAHYRQRLDTRRRELGLSMTATMIELVRRGLDEPPPPTRQARHSQRIRPGLIEEAVLAAVLGIEHTRLLVESLLPPDQEPREDLLEAAAVAADDRLATARSALGVQ